MSEKSDRTNRLAGESSPYLLLHQHNPVDWFPWGDEALSRARELERPIFLSVGYSTCYWCHVMERESFSNRETAELMNAQFVNIKVDREERPDLDEIYMTATQIFSGHGGWPNSVFLTPELEPFFAGTYFPPDDRGGLPGFPRVLRSLAEAWKSRKDEVAEQAAGLSGAMRKYLEERAEVGTEPPLPAVAERSFELLERRFDSRWGGFGSAPKFPTPSNLLLLEEMAEERPRAAQMLTETLDRMAAGGICDQLGGGFHRYSTDERWLVPHFEKMLYDNALLLGLYARQWARTGDEESARVAVETAGFMNRELSGPDGEFWSALDAETDGHEGAFYVWTRDELLEVLGEEDFGFLAPIYGFDREPNFEAQYHVLHLPTSLASQGERRRKTTAELLEDMAPLRRRLLETRSSRPALLTDDKVLADWNGMAIAGMAVAGRLLPDPALAERAEAAARFALDRLRPEGVLRHSWRDGRFGRPAFLSDYVHLVRGLLELAEASQSERWLAAAVELATEQEERLGDERGGYFGAAESPELLYRSKELFDGATPGANALATLNALELAERTGEAVWRERAERALIFFAPLVEGHPEGARLMTVAARRFGGAVTTSGSAAPAAETLRDQAPQVVTASLELDPAGDGGERTFRLALEIAEGWHLYAHGVEGGLEPTRLGASGAELNGVRYPEGLPTELAPGDEVAIYEGSVEIVGRLGPGSEARLVLTCQPCSGDRCLAPLRLEVPVDGP